jgi:hypothetical protein
MRAIAGMPARELATTKTQAKSREVKSGKNIKSSRDNSNDSDARSSKKLSYRNSKDANNAAVSHGQKICSNQQKPHKIVRVDSYSFGIWNIRNGSLKVEVQYISSA